MLPQCSVERRAKWHFAVLAALAFTNVDLHHRFVNVGYLQVRDLGPACAGAICDQSRVRW